MAAKTRQVGAAAVPLAGPIKRVLAAMALVSAKVVCVAAAGVVAPMVVPLIVPPVMATLAALKVPADDMALATKAVVATLVELSFADGVLAVRVVNLPVPAVLAPMVTPFRLPADTVTFGIIVAALLVNVTVPAETTFKLPLVMPRPYVPE